LGHNSWWRQSEAWEVEYILCWEDYPFAFVDHVNKFLVKKVNILKFEVQSDAGLAWRRAEVVVGSMVALRI
jgi:hypothetical protein